MSWQAIAERAAKARCAAILERMRDAVADHAPGALIEAEDNAMRVRGRGLRQRWLADSGLRFARRIMR